MLTPILCSCGCLQPLLAGNFVNLRGELKNHNRLGGLPSYLVEDRGYETPCWIWQGGLNKWGYAKVKRDGVTQGAHRLFYSAYIRMLAPSHVGRDGLDHLCRVRKCVNPEHLELVTCVENIRRGLVPTVARWGHSNIGEHLEEIRARYLQGESQYSIAKSFGVHQPAISRILTAKRWAGIAVPTATRSPIKLSPEQVDEIRQRVVSGESRASLAVIFGIGQSQISRIVRGESWATSM